MEIDFSRIEIFTDVAHKNCSIADVRTQFADAIYNLGKGIEAHALALKIYNSDGPTDFNENEINLIERYSELCTPAFIDAMERIIHQHIEE